ncbi:MAG: PD-(D/E)XK nuclease family protein [Bacteroidales bacterium]
MEIKRIGSPKSVLTLFDLLGNDETALSKAFAFVLGAEKDALADFLKFIGVRKRITEKSFRQVLITTEYSRDEGRTDIEIEIGSETHIIIEAKVKKNRLHQQRTQYLTAFNQSAKEKILVFLTQERDSNKQIAADVKIINTSWLDVTGLFDHKKFIDNKLIFQFLRYVSKNYKMKEQKEILIQDLSDKTELKRYREHNLYRRGQTFGTPLYFSPYFTRSAEQPEGEGISYLSKILGVLTLNPIEIDNYETDLRRFKNDNETIKKWTSGVKLNSVDTADPMTYYFLDEPVKIKENLLKDGGNKKGRGKNWIAAMIPKNRCVTFEEFVRRMNK